jgi:hypothetical protein
MGVVFGAVLIVAGLALIAGLIWPPRQRWDDRR